MDIPPVIPFPSRKEPDDFMSGYWEGLGDGYDLAEKASIRGRWKWAALGCSAGFFISTVVALAVTIFVY
jgi:hypothetical protein